MEKKLKITSELVDEKKLFIYINNNLHLYINLDNFISLDSYYNTIDYKDYHNLNSKIHFTINIYLKDVNNVVKLEYVDAENLGLKVLKLIDKNIRKYGL